MLAVGIIFDAFVKIYERRYLTDVFIGLIISFLGVLPLDVRNYIEDMGEQKQQQLDDISNVKGITCGYKHIEEK